jgi:TPR repeat protein
MPRLVVCPSCYHDMTAVPSVARFCPTCGSQLPPRDAAGFLIPPEESSPLFPVYKALRDELEGKLADESPQQATSLIILAYANALLNLGWRYEHGRGLLRNVEEAARCYAKAGKLSEAWAKGREA